MQENHIIILCLGLYYQETEVECASVCMFVCVSVTSITDN